jgi:3-oxoacyl-[acyl-carrier-protein] synthase-3
LRYQRVHLEAFGYELAPIVVTSAALEDQLAPLYASLGIPAGQLEALTGIKERRFWPHGAPVSQGAVCAANKALEASQVSASDLGALVYTGVCREGFEPATACRVAHEVGGIRSDCAIYDVGNACLGVLSGVVDVANRIELGQIRAGMVVSCESSREIVDTMIAAMIKDGGMARFAGSLATLTGGSGAVALLLTDGSFGPPRRRLLGGVVRATPEHHRLCRWGYEDGPEGAIQFMATDAVGVLKHGVALGIQTYRAMLKELGWDKIDVERARSGRGIIDRVICHQVGSAHQAEILHQLGIPQAKDFTTFATLGNIGTVSLPLTAAIAEEQGFVQPGDRVGFLGIGSGLNCLMLGWEW